jgi:hypothetical protein
MNISVGGFGYSNNPVTDFEPVAYGVRFKWIFRVLAHLDQRWF